MVACTPPESLDPACDARTTSIDIPPRPAWLKRKPTRTTEAAERAAHKYGVTPADVLRMMPEALGIVRQQWDTIDRARRRARQLTGLDARIIASRENRYLDHSTACRFDETSRELAAEFPDLGFDPDGHDTPQRVWGFIRQGRQPMPVRHSDCVAELAAQWVYQWESGDYPDDADGFDPSEWDLPLAGEILTDDLTVTMETETTFEDTEPCRHDSSTFQQTLTVGARPPVTHSIASPRLDVSVTPPNRPALPLHSTNTADLSPTTTTVATDMRSTGSRHGATVDTTGPTNNGLSGSLSSIKPVTGEPDTVETERNHHAAATPSRDIPLPPSRGSLARGDGRRRKATRQHPRALTLPTMRPVHFARVLVRPHRTGRAPCHREATGHASHRLGRVTGRNTAYAAGNGFPAWIHRRDGPAVIRQPVCAV